MSFPFIEETFTSRPPDSELSVVKFKESPTLKLFPEFTISIESTEPDFTDKISISCSKTSFVSFTKS